MWLDKRYHSLDYELKKRYGTKIYKLALDGGFTCPNRDGKLDTRGCIFCSGSGSGDFAQSAALSVTEQIEAGKALLTRKKTGDRYIAYFQAYTSTYGPLSRMRALFYEAIRHPDVAILSIATRPDCLPDDVLDLLEELNRIKPVWIELGLQSMHEATAHYIRRGYPLSVFEEAVQKLKARHIETIVHVILGLPGESKDDMVASTRYLASLPIDGIKFQLLHILRGTDLAADYEKGLFEALTLKAYLDILIACLEILPASVTVHRITGDGPKNLLIAPLWSGNKKMVLNTIQHELKVRDTYQGRCLTPNANDKGE